MRRLVRRAAAFLWMTPLRSRLVETLLGHGAAPQERPRCPARRPVTAAFERVFSSDLTALLRSARLAFVLMRFFWLLMFATRPGFLCVQHVVRGLEKGSRPGSPDPTRRRLATGGGR